MSIAVKGGRVFVNGQFIESEVLIDNGRIAAIGKSLESDETIDATGQLVLPGLIDPHVHLREPGGERKEDFASGTQAAVAGGFTTVIDMPNNPLPTITAERLEQKKELAAKKAVCDVGFHFGATDTNFDEVEKAHPDSLKIYMGKTTGELMLRDEGSLERHVAGFDPGKPIVVHASDDSADETANLEKTFANEERMVMLAGRYRQRVHLAHASTSHEMDIFKRFRKASVETAPHYLFLDSSDAGRLGKLGLVYPPLRSQIKRQSLWDELERIDCIATDHAPHTKEDKEAGAHGFPGLETSLALMLDAYSRKMLGLEWIISRMSQRPAEIFNLKGKGRIELGYEGSLTLVDLKKEWTVKGEELFTKCRWSPWEGKKLKGKVHSVIYKGELIFEDGGFSRI